MHKMKKWNWLEDYMELSNESKAELREFIQLVKENECARRSYERTLKEYEWVLKKNAANEDVI